MGISTVNTNYYSQISSGIKIQSAADGAAEMSIIQGEQAQVKGIDQGVRNSEDGKSVLNIADSAYGHISDSLQRIRELAVYASNTAVVTDSDRQNMQFEVDQLKQGIADIANYTEFNTKKLLDGSNADMHIQTGANSGQSQVLDTGNATLKALGIEDFDLTKDFSIQTIDDAINQVSSNRSRIGAQSNALDYTIGYNTQTSYNLTKTISNMQDTDIAKAVTELQKKELFQTVQFMMQKRQEEEEQKKLGLLYM